MPGISGRLDSGGRVPGHRVAPLNHGSPALVNRADDRIGDPLPFGDQPQQRSTDTSLYVIIALRDGPAAGHCAAGGAGAMAG